RNGRCGLHDLVQTKPQPPQPHHRKISVTERCKHADIELIEPAGLDGTYRLLPRIDRVRKAADELPHVVRLEEERHALGHWNIRLELVDLTRADCRPNLSTHVIGVADADLHQTIAGVILVDR